jgi:hypothetical protein
MSPDFSMDCKVLLCPILGRQCGVKTFHFNCFIDPGLDAVLLGYPAENQNDHPGA